MNDMSIGMEHARFLGSMFVTVLASQATMLVDASVGGNLLGVEAVSAVDLVMPVYELFYALVLMLGMGGCTVASLCLGRGDVEAVRRHFTAAVLTSLVLMGLMGAGILVFRIGVVRMLCGGISMAGTSGSGNESVLLGMTQDYLVAMVPYFVISGVSGIFMLFTAMAGRPGLVMWSAIAQFATNVTCNLLLINVSGMGIEALAYSSALGATVVLVMLLPNYFEEGCSFRMERCPGREILRALGGNVRFGGGFIAVEMAYAVMVYSMNALVLKFGGEHGLFLWSVVMMIYLTCDYASVAAQETLLSLGGRLLGAGDRAGFRKVYYRSLLFVLGWIGLILTGVFVLPDVVLPMFGAVETEEYSAVMKAVALAVPFIVGVTSGNLFLVRLVQRGKVVRYAVLSWTLYMAVPTVYWIAQL